MPQPPVCKFDKVKVTLYVPTGVVLFGPGIAPVVLFIVVEGVIVYVPPVAGIVDLTGVIVVVDDLQYGLPA